MKKTGSQNKLISDYKAELQTKYRASPPANKSSILKKISDISDEDDPKYEKRNLILRYHFYNLTMDILQPIYTYLQTLVPNIK